MTFEDIVDDVRNQIARITINRPRQYYAFTGDTLEEMACCVDEFADFLGQGDRLRRHLAGPEFWAEEQQEGERAFLEKRAPDFSRCRRRRQR